MVDIETKFIDFIGVERFDLIIDSYLVNIGNCMKIKGQEVQAAQLMTFKFDKKIRELKYSKYCSVGMEDFIFQRWTRGLVCLKGRGLEVFKVFNFGIFMLKEMLF